jgi:hypothetical protein
MPSFGSDAIDDALDDDLVELDDEPDARDSETIPKTHDRRNADHQRSSTGEVTIGDCARVANEARRRHGMDSVDLEVCAAVAAGEYESVPAALDARRDPQPSVEATETVVESTETAEAVSGFDNGGARTPGQARDGHDPDVEVDVPGEKVREAKLKALFEARDRVRQFRAESAERGFKMQSQIGDRDARDRVVTYAEELEPLLSRSRVGRQLYTELSLGEIELDDVQPPDPPGRGTGTRDRVIEVDPVEVVGIKGFLETGPVVRETVEYTRSNRGVLPGTSTETETLATPVPSEISSRAYRALNGYLEEIGLDLDASHRGREVYGPSDDRTL